MAIDTIKFKRGVKSKLNNLSYGEPAYISDENELYIGTENGVEKITRNKEVAELSSQLEQNMNETNEKFNVIINKTYAEFFGVKGDGGNYTNELNNAILASNGGCVILPEGSFYIDNIQNVKEGMILEGSGKTKTIIKKSTTGTLLEFNNPYQTYCKDLEFRDLTFYGSDIADLCLDIYSTSHVNLKNVKITNFRNALRFDDVTQPLFENCTIRDNVENGVILGRQSDSVNIISSDFFNNGGYGLIIGESTKGTSVSTPSTKADGVNIIGCAFTKNNIGILVKGGQTVGVNIKGSYFERNTTNHIQISEPSGSTVYGCEIDNSFFNGGNVTSVAIKNYSILSTSIRYNCFINHTTGAVDLVNNTNCKYIRNEVVNSGYALKMPNGETYSAGSKELIIGKDFYDRTDYINHGLILPNGSNSSRPSANIDMRGYVFVNEKSSSENDILQICVKKNDGTYYWQDYQPISSGSTRPTVSQWGFQHFDTILNKPIWWVGKWVDSTGATV